MGVEKRDNYLSKYKVLANKLTKKCSPDLFKSLNRKKFTTYIPLGQKDVFNALEMAINVKGGGYNIFAMGTSGIGKNQLISSFLEKKAKNTNSLKDWAYVYNFEHPESPTALEFSGGQARIFQNDMKEFLEDLKVVIPSLFESETYRKKHNEIIHNFSEKQLQSISNLQEKATEYKLSIVKLSDEFSVVPVGKDNTPLTPQQLTDLTKEEKVAFSKHIKYMQQKLEKLLTTTPLLERQKKARIQQLNLKLVKKVIIPLIKQLKNKWKNKNIHSYLDDVYNFTLNNLAIFLPKSKDDKEATPLLVLSTVSAFNKYGVNVIIDNNTKLKNKNKPPIVFVDTPSYSRLFGKIEYTSQLGGLTTDFSLIKGGALHEANGGYLILDARKILEVPWLWEALKHTIKNKCIQIIPPENIVSTNSLTSLDPQPIPLNIKIILVGEPSIYYKLWEYDSEFQDLFKMVANFDQEVPYDNENALKYAEIINNSCYKENLKYLDDVAYTKIIEIGAKIAGSQHYLTTNLSRILSIVKEASFLAKQRGSKYIEVIDITKAHHLQKDRVSKYNMYWEKNIKDKTILITTSGEEIGQINGLSVVTINDFTFGQTQRITASVYKGHKGLIDIEKSVNLSGSIHSKGVMILQSFLNSHFGQDHPMAFSASLVFEQSYGSIDGDSATCAETLALLSALSSIPLSQSLAITGSMDQKGRVQPIGGVNYKIEGFFNVCKIQGFNGKQGVVIPKSNSKDLMLPQEIVEAVEKGLFHIYAIENISEAIEIFTGSSTKTPNEKGDDHSNSMSNIIKKKWVQTAKELD